MLTATWVFRQEREPDVRSFVPWIDCRCDCHKVTGRCGTCCARQVRKPGFAYRLLRWLLEVQMHGVRLSLVENFGKEADA
jgi:hypothetical protein